MVFLMSKPNVFCGRVVFDHIPKTAGQAINAWLRKELGDGCVTTNLIGGHRELIRRYGGDYSIISAHVAFSGEGLDPRYQYVACLREPIDRAISWLYFAVNNHLEVDELKHLREAVNTFIDSEGEMISADLMGHIVNPYVAHFSSIKTMAAGDDAEKLSLALDAVTQYDMFGFYEQLPAFLSDFAARLQIPAPAQIARSNVTRDRPQLEKISPKFIKRLEELIALDSEFYRILYSRYSSSRRVWQLPAVVESPWVHHVSPAPRIFSSPEFALISASLDGSSTRINSSVMEFVLDFSISTPVRELEAGIHIFDEQGRWAFGINSTLLGHKIALGTPGRYRERFAIVANLPDGEYTAGFAFADRSESDHKELAWYDRVFGFRITLDRSLPFVGYSYIPSTLTVHPTNGSVVNTVTDARGSLTCGALLGEMLLGERLEVPVRLSNTSTQDWVGLHFYPINLSYRWMDDSGNVISVEGERTPLPNGSLMAGACVDTKLALIAPDSPGRYRLCAMPVQEMVTWFDVCDFSPLEQTVLVVATNCQRKWLATDPRIHGRVGHATDGARVTDEKEGYFVYGPYARVLPGTWQAELLGRFESGDTALRADVAANCGVPVASQNVVFSDTRITVNFVLEREVTDWEMRLWVSAETVARVECVILSPQVASGANKGLKSVPRKRASKPSASVARVNQPRSLAKPASFGAGVSGK